MIRFECEDIWVRRNDRALMENRGLLTDDDRRFFRGEKDIDPDGAQARNKRSRVRRRIENIAEDLEILREAGEDDLVATFEDETGAYARLDERLQEVEEFMESQRNAEE